MKRLCIYVIYDKQQKINAYIEAVLRELKKFVTDIIVVCNFERIIEGEEHICPYASKVFFRGNIGFDAGAYKDALLDFITWDKALSYDELLLTNDTYFAPIYPMDEMFRHMENENCDFWGITKNNGGYAEGIGNFVEHIQSFFLVFKNAVFHSEHFRCFWDRYTYAEDKEHTILSFEIGINLYLAEKGYTGSAYMDYYDLPFAQITGVNPYAQYAYELIKDARLPIIKKTNFYGKNRWLLNTFAAMEYIEQNTGYDTSLIRDYISEYQKKGLIGTYFDLGAMEEFVKNHSRLYIYGSGVWGQITAAYFKKKGWQYECFLVTERRGRMDKTERDEDIKLFSEAVIEKNDGIIIAQEYKNVCEEIMQYIGEGCSESQIFTPCYPKE